MATCIFCKSLNRVKICKADNTDGVKRIQLLKEFGVQFDEIYTCRCCLRKIDSMSNRISAFRTFCQSATTNRITSSFSSNPATASHPLISLHPTTIIPSPSTNVCKTLAGSLQRHFPAHIQPGFSNMTTPIKAVPNLKKSNAVKRVLFSDNDDHSYAGKQQQESVFKKRKKTSSSTMETVPGLNSMAAAAHNNQTTSLFISTADYGILLKSINSRNVNTVVDAIHQNPQLMKGLNSKMMGAIDNTAAQMGNRLHGHVSTLMKKDYNKMKYFSWAPIVNEGCKKFPALIGILLHLALGKSRMIDNAQVDKLVPKIGLILGILLQNRHHELSLVQRSVSILLFDSISDQKVYDRLQPLGVCLCHESTTDLLETIGGCCHHELVEIVKNRKRFRLVGDNVNWHQGVAEERQGKHSHMVHAFGSLAIEQPCSFDQLDTSPRPPFYEIQTNMYLLNKIDWVQIRTEYVELIRRVAGRIIPYFPHKESPIVGPHTVPCSAKSKVVPLPLLFRNEQKYSDVVEILDFYEETVKQVYEDAGVPLEGSVLIGGDQLTRERFSGAKRLRIGGVDDAQKFNHLGPITFELFHLMMNFLILIYKQLYKDDTISELGTIMCEKVRINRSKVSDNVRNTYSENKEFFISLVDSYIVEAILTHFGMETINDAPTQNTQQPNDNSEEWLQQQIESIVDKYITPSMEETLEKLHKPPDIEVDGQAITIATNNNVIIDVLLKPQKKQAATSCTVDEIGNHAKYILELGMLFKSLLDLIHYPDRDRGLRLLKYIMLVFRCDNTRSKYAYEIMRLLVHQYVILSDQEAHREFYSLFFNASGNVGEHVPVDLRMENHVDLLKQHINHMFSNKTDKNITNKTRALGVVKEISKSYDASTHTRIRARKHSIASANEDEQKIVADLRSIRPFSCSAGSEQAGLHLQSPSLLTDIDANRLHEWVCQKNYEYATEQGN